MYISRILRLAVWFFLMGCSQKITPTTTSNTASNGKYAEDLSAWRPKVAPIIDTAKTSNAANNGREKVSRYVEPKFSVNQALDAVLDSIGEVNRSRGVFDGFTIQVYSGIKREDALNVKRQLSTSMPKLDSEIQFVQPNFRVRAGKYYNRIQAQKDYEAVKQYFPDAIVIPDKIAFK
jgi:hypothetical protein